MLVSKALLGLVDLRTYAERDKTSSLPLQLNPHLYPSSQPDADATVKHIFKPESMILNK